jgi:hypothetical protein
MQRRASVFCSIVLGSALLAPTVAAAPVSQDCEFKLGFAALASMLPDTVGQCLADESFSPINGDSRQPTSGGLLVWRKADNWTVFTDGTSTFLNGPDGLQQRPNSQRFSWEIDAGSYLAAEPTVQFADLKPEDAIVASLHAADVQQLFPGEQWFESFPVFHQSPFAGNPSVQWLNRRFLVSTHFQRMSGVPAELDTSIAVFETEADAVAGMAELTATGDQDGVEMTGAPIASESHYYARVEGENANEHVAVVRWR